MPCRRSWDGKSQVRRISNEIGKKGRRLSPGIYSNFKWTQVFVTLSDTLTVGTTVWRRGTSEYLEIISFIYIFDP